MLLAFIPTFSVVSFSPEVEILGVSFVEEAYAQSSVELAPVVAVADQAATLPEEEIKPVLDILAGAIKYINMLFPKAGPVIQGTLEAIAGLTTLFTLLSVFLIGFLKIPIVLARVGRAHELAEKIQAFSDKITPYFKYLSIFNVQKK